MAESKHDGGSAFPESVAVSPSGDLAYGFGGMTLRDWFAGQALAGIMAQSHTGPKDWQSVGFGWGEDTANSLNKGEKHFAMAIAGFSYAIADAMLAERSKP